MICPKCGCSAPGVLHALLCLTPTPHHPDCSQKNPHSMDASFRQIPIYAMLTAMQDNALCMVVDADHTFDLDAAKRAGVDPAKILISEPSSTDQAAEIIETILRTGTIRLVVVLGFESLLTGDKAATFASLSRTLGTTVMFAAS